MLAVWVANVHAVLLLFATDTLAGGREKGERFAVNRQRLYPFAAGFSVPVKARSMSPLRNVGRARSSTPSSPSTVRSAWDRCDGALSRLQQRSRSSRRSTHHVNRCSGDAFRRHGCLVVTGGFQAPGLTKANIQEAQASSSASTRSTGYHGGGTLSRTVSGCLAKRIKRLLQYFAAIEAITRSAISRQAPPAHGRTRDPISTFTKGAVVLLESHASARGCDSPRNTSRR